MTNARTILLILGIAALIGPHAFAADVAPPEVDVLKTLRAGHPRLIVTSDDLSRVKQAIASDPTAKAWFDALRPRCDKMLTEPVSQRVLLGPRLLTVSREVLVRTMSLGGMYRLTGERKYADRARDEMLAAARFSDWHPPHFLDVAEMTNAMAVGYDLLFDVLTPEERAEIRDAIVTKGLEPGLKVYGQKSGWHTNTNNWNQVCNGGMIAGALTIADEKPEIARQIIEHARTSIPRALAQYAPDGGDEEGPGYWAYAASYTTFFFADLHNALGTDLGLLQSPGLADAGLFRIHTIGPTGATFNFADAGEGVTPAPEMLWMAGAFSRPEYAEHERQRCADLKNVTMLHLLWLTPGGEDKLAALPRAKYFQRVNVALMRSAWNDRTAAFVGFKGGDNRASHAHLDLGTFVYDVDGVRWANDLGPDDYNLPGYFGRQRWDYYRLRTEGHNTLTIDGRNQDTKAKAPIVAFAGGGASGKERVFAIADLSAGYPAAKRVRRGVELIGRQLLVQDEIQSDDAVDVVWNLHSPATIEPAADGRSAVLSHNHKQVTVRLLAPESARFAVADADVAPATQPNPPMRKVVHGSKKLIVRQAEKTKDLRLVVLISPDGENASDRPIESLDQWMTWTLIKR